MSQPPWEPPTQPPPPPPNVPRPVGPPPMAPPGYGAPLPPPQKSRVGLIIGIVVGSLALIAVVVLAVVLVAGSDSGSDEGSASDDESSSEPSESPSESETPVVREGEVLQGNGYTYVLPEEWTDITDDVTGQPGSGTIDTTSAPGASIETAPANLIVEAGDANGETDLESARDQVSANLGGVVGATPVEIDGPNIGGVATVGLEVTSTSGAGVKVLQNAYVTILHDTYYVIGYSRESGNHDYDEDFEAILDSWTWE